VNTALSLLKVLVQNCCRQIKIKVGNSGAAAAAAAAADSAVTLRRSATLDDVTRMMA